MYEDKFNAAFGMSFEEFTTELRLQHAIEKDRLTKVDESSDKKTYTTINGKELLLKIVAHPRKLANSKISGSNDISQFLKLIDIKIEQLGKAEKKVNDSNSFVSTFRKLIHLEKKNDEPEDTLQSLHFENSFSNYYSLLYNIAKLYEYIENPNKTRIIEITDSHNLILFQLIRTTEFYLNTKSTIFAKGNQKPNDSEYIKEICREYMLMTDLSREDFNCLLLSIQLCVFIRFLVEERIDKETVFHQVDSKLATECVEYCYQNDDYEYGILFSLNALKSSSPNERQNAVNLLGLCLTNSSQYQFAYDTYLSWIYKEAVGYLQKQLNGTSSELNNMLQSAEEETWRQNNKKSVAIMYGNFSYVCATMYELLGAQRNKEELYCLAEHFIKEAHIYDDKSPSYLCTLGTLCSMKGREDEAIRAFQEYLKCSEGTSDIVCAKRSLITEYKGSLKKIAYEDYEKLCQGFLKSYSELSEYKNAAAKLELTKGRDLYNILNVCNSLSETSRRLQFTLLRIDSIKNKILGNLRWKIYIQRDYDLQFDSLPAEARNTLYDVVRDVASSDDTDTKKNDQIKKISYYAKLSDLQYIFKAQPQGNGANLNCLTMMHARYMNDPEEGLILLQKLHDYLLKTPENMRDELYDQKYVFLKSFTGLIDQLNMWTAYGSDRSAGSDCNGCCVIIAPETFDSIVNIEDGPLLKASINENDDYSLYNIAYFNGDKIVVDGEENEKTENLFEELKVSLTELNNDLKDAEESSIKTVYNCLAYIFEKLMFLFKDISYSLEKESRLIITRDINATSEIHKTTQEPPKLLIYPSFQIYPEKIILGPKTENTDNWIPYLQYELSKIGEKWPFSSERVFRPTVRASRINIR